MGHTNQTANYNLPQFVGTDKPSWLGDINDAFAAIDTAIAAAASEASTADGKADALTTTVSGHTTQIGTLQNTVTSQGNTLNTVTSLIGNGTPTTTDQTIIGAINELHADQGDLDDLQTTDKSSLVAAINEAAAGGGGGSQSVRYYNGYLQYTPDNGVTWVNFYNTAPEDALIPAMTSNTTPSGTASADSYESGHEAYKAFDQDATTYWSPATSSSSGWVQYDFGSQKVVTKATIKALYATQARLKNFKIQASNDGVTFTDLYSGVYPNDNTEPSVTVDINNVAPYQYYRLAVLDTYNSSDAAVKVFQVLGH